MAGVSVSENDILTTLRALEAHGGSVRAAAQSLGLARSTVQARLRGAQARNITLPDDLGVEYPDLPESELKARELVEQAAKEFSRRMASHEARRWFEIKVKTNQPIGVVFMGDPHVDNPGTNWPLLLQHVDLLEKTPGLYAIGGNDVADNWIGRLVRLYADATMSRKQTLKVIKWLIKDSKIKWLCHVLGNHDAWGDGPYLLKATAQPFVPVEDWQARFQLVFPNGSRTRKVRVCGSSLPSAHHTPGTAK